MTTSSTAVASLFKANERVYCVAALIADYLKDFEGTGHSLSFNQIAEGVGVELGQLTQTQLFLFYMSAEAACKLRGWDRVSEPGQLGRFLKMPKVTEHRKPAMSPSAAARARRKRAIAR